MPELSPILLPLGGAPSVAEQLKGVELDDRTSLVSQICEVLREMIVTLQLPPGQRISEIEIADALNASKTPVREALIRLEDSGLVQIVPRSGTYVTPIRIERYLEGCFIRLQLEIGAGRRAARNCAGGADAGPLAATIDVQVAALAGEDFVGFFQADEAFHQAVFELAGVGGAWASAKRGHADLDRVRHLKRIYRIRRSQEVVAQHRAILAAIGGGDADGAEAAIVAHLGSLDQEIAGLAENPLLLAYIERINNMPPGRRAPRG